MKYNLKIIFYVFTLCLLSSCSQNFPENYGIYAYTDKGRDVLIEHQTFFSGNLIQTFAGLKGFTGVGYKFLTHFIVFEKNIDPKTICISQLGFKKKSYVQNIIGNTCVDVNLWIPEKNIDFDIAPVDGKIDMYKLTPKEKLTDGFYALHLGRLGRISAIEASAGNLAFDFVIGNNCNYQSFEVIQKTNEEKIKAEAEGLLKKMNNYFNSREYIKMREIYKPDGMSLSDVEWQSFTDGMRTWINSAGIILTSTIISASISENEGIFQIQTVYEKKGQQIEKLVVKKLKEKYCITSLE